MKEEGKMKGKNIMKLSNGATIEKDGNMFVYHLQPITWFLRNTEESVRSNIRSDELQEEIISAMKTLLY